MIQPPTTFKYILLFILPLTLSYLPLPPLFCFFPLVSPLPPALLQMVWTSIVAPHKLLPSLFDMGSSRHIGVEIIDDEIAHEDNESFNVDFDFVNRVGARKCAIPQTMVITSTMIVHTMRRLTLSLTPSCTPPLSPPPLPLQTITCISVLVISV